MSIKGRLRDLWTGKYLEAKFRNSYRSVLFGQYRGIDAAEAKKEADEIVAKKEENTNWEDLYRLELAIIKLEPEAALRRRAWILRNEYEEVASPQEREDYRASHPPTASDGDLTALRADLIRLQ